MKGLSETTWSSCARGTSVWPGAIKTLAAAVGFIIAVSAATVVTAQPAQPAPSGESESPSVSVTGVGQVQAAPDMAEVSVGVVTEASSAQQALTANNRAMEQLFNVLQQQGIAEKDRQTTSFNVSPQFRHDDGRRPPNADGTRQPQIVGYQVSNIVRIKVRKVSNLGAVLDAVVGAGSNQIHGIQFSIDEQEDLKDQARRQAMQQARRKAELLAQAADARVGRVLKIDEYEEGGGPGPQPRMMMMEASRSVPIAEGEQTVEARVRVSYRLETDGLVKDSEN